MNSFELPRMSDFTPRLQQVLQFAGLEAHRFNHDFIGTEHVLLGMIKLGQGVWLNVLHTMGVNLEAVREEIQKEISIGPNQEAPAYLPYTPRVKKVLELASKEAKSLKHTYVGTEHLLLGLLAEGGGMAARVLKKFNVDIERTRQEILKELDPNFSPPDKGEKGKG